MKPIILFALTTLTAQAAPERLLYECRTYGDVAQQELVQLYGPAAAPEIALGAESITRIAIRSAGAAEDRQSRAVLDARNAAGQAYRLASTRNGVKASDDFLVTLYDVRTQGNEVPGLFVLYPGTKRTEMPVLCTSMR